MPPNNISYTIEAFTSMWLIKPRPNFSTSNIVPALIKHSDLHIGFPLLAHTKRSLMALPDLFRGISETTTLLCGNSPRCELIDIEVVPFFDGS